MRLFLVCLVLLFALESLAGAQELSTQVYPSEDEVYEAWINGEIDIAQLQILMELANQKVDTAEFHLLDQVPNLSFFRDHLKTSTTQLQKEQLASFETPDVDRSRVRGHLTHQYTLELESEGRDRYRTGARFFLGDQWKAGLKLQREYSGRERFTHRYLTYKSNSGVMHEVTLGNFTRRFGLGSIIGYRGKILRYSDQADYESLRFPDYGGLNGLYTRIVGESYQVEHVNSYVRDADFSMRVDALMFQYQFAKWRPSLILGHNLVSNRHTESKQRFVDVGMNLQYEYASGYLEGEVSLPMKGRTSPSAVLAEGRHRFRDAQVIFSGWSYAEDFHDLSSGSKKANLRRMVELDDVPFEYSTRRAGQDGFLLKTIARLNDDIDIVNSAIIARVPHEQSLQELLAGIVGRLGDRWSIRADLNLERRIEKSSIGEEIDKTGRTRVEVRYIDGNLSARSYIAHNSRNGREDHLSWLVRARYTFSGAGTAEIWSNVSQMEPETGKVEYWYVYVRHEQELISGLTLAFKLARTYNRSAIETVKMVGQIELTAAI